MGTVDIHEGSTADIRHTGTTKDSIQVASMHSNSGITTCITGVTAAIDVTAYNYLRLRHHSGEEHHQAYYGISCLHWFIFQT